MTQALHQPIHGIVPPLVTPLREADRLDSQAVARLVEHVLQGGVAGVFVLGTCGEGLAVAHEVRCQMIEETCEAVAGRVPVLVGVSNPSLGESLAYAEIAAQAGAAAIVSTPPFYYPLSDRERSDHLLRLAERSPLPLLVYNMPSCTGSSLTAEMIDRLACEANIVGVKDSAGDLKAFRELVLASRCRPDWSLLVGPERLLADAIRAGATGAVNGGSNVFPHLFVAFYQAAAAGRHAEVELLTAQVKGLEGLYGSPITAGSVITGLKAALAELEICTDVASPLFRPVDPQRRERIAEVVRQVQQLKPLAIS